MSEADTPNNQPLPEPTGSVDDSAVDLPDPIEPSEYPTIINFPALLEFRDVVPISKQEEAIALDTTDTTDTTPTPSLTSTDPDYTDNQTPELTERRIKDADWFALAQKMRQRNRRLLDQITELRQALQEKQEALQSEQMRSRDRETFLTQQSEELNTAQEQLSRLFHTLESSHQAAQRQQILVETLSEQLQNSQERIAQLERECALTQQRYNEQSHQLLQAANTCQELRTRLQRQQRQTLQFKVALEKSLEMQPTRSSVGQQPHQLNIGAQSIIHKAQPIQPWSAEPELAEDSSDFDTLWNRPIRLEPLSDIYSSQIEAFEVRHIEEPAFEPTGESADSIEVTITTSPENAAMELELEQQLLAEMTSLAEASGLSEYSPNVALAPAPTTLEPEVNLEESDNPESSMRKVEETPSPEDSREQHTEVEIPPDELWEDSDYRKPDQSNEVMLPQSSWPSPILYPLRTPKKRKSLAAIELPSFPRYRPS